MKFLVGKIPFVLVLLGLLRVDGFTEDEIRRAIRYIGENLTRNIRGQHAYIVTFPANVCNDFTDANIGDTLSVEDVHGINDRINREEIYIGHHMVVAKYRKVKVDNKEYTEHSEYRLLYPERSSPAETLLNGRPGCVLFYTVNSPCTTKCCNLKKPQNILVRLPIFNNIANRALAFSQVFWYDANNNNIWAFWRRINQNIPLYKCDGNSCNKCYSATGEQNNNCLPAVNQDPNYCSSSKTIY